MFVSHLQVSLEKCLFRYFAHLLISFIIFLVLSFMSFLYILKINPLSVVSFAMIFSHSEGCLFTLLLISFAMQKLLSLLRSHLFTFVFTKMCLSSRSKDTGVLFFYFQSNSKKLPKYNCLCDNRLLVQIIHPRGKSQFSVTS